MKETHTMSTITSPRPPAHFPGDADTSLVAATANLPVSADRPFARTSAPLGAPDVIASRASALQGCDLRPPSATVEAARIIPGALARAAGQANTNRGMVGDAHHDTARSDTAQRERTWCEALFASALQPSDSPTAEMVAEAISSTVRQFGVRGCAGRMAQEFGDHPDAAASRMRWVRQLAHVAGGGR
jgi:hypothetical protein